MINGLQRCSEGVESRLEATIPKQQPQTEALKNPNYSPAPPHPRCGVVQRIQPDKMERELATSGEKKCILRGGKKAQGSQE